jgi:hypothetical protein
MLEISIKNIETHRAGVIHKLMLHTSTGFVRYAVRNNIVRRGRAVLLREDGTRMAQELVALLGLTVPPPPEDRTDTKGLQNRLRAASYGLREEAGFQSYLVARTGATALINALSNHLGKSGMHPVARQ